MINLFLPQVRFLELGLQSPSQTLKNLKWKAKLATILSLFFQRVQTLQCKFRLPYCVSFLFGILTLTKNAELIMLKMKVFIYEALVSDTFIITPRTVDAVISTNLRCHWGIAEHSVSSDDPDYDGLHVEGVAVKFSMYMKQKLSTSYQRMVRTVSPSGFIPPSYLIQKSPCRLRLRQTVLLLNGSSLSAYELVFDVSMEPQYVTAMYNTDTFDNECHRLYSDDWVWSCYRGFNGRIIRKHGANNQTNLCQGDSKHE